MISKKRIFETMAGLVAAIALAACSSASPTATPVVPADVATATPTAVPAVPTGTRSVATPTAPQNDDDLIAAGEELFARTAGGIGCSYCHGDDAAGDLLQGAPDVRGVSELQIFDALESRAQMTFLTLTDAEVKAIATYLGTLSSAQ